MTEILKKVRYFVSYSFTDGKLIISYKRKPWFTVAKDTRKEAFDYVKLHEASIVATIAKKLWEKGELPA